MKELIIPRDVAARFCAWVEWFGSSIAEIIAQILTMRDAVAAFYDSPEGRKYERNRKKAVARRRRNNASRRGKK